MNRETKISRKGKEKVDFPEIDQDVSSNEHGLADWTTLPKDFVLGVFSNLNYHDRAILSTTCRTFFALGKSPCLWTSLDLRGHRYTASAITFFASRCQNLQKLRLGCLRSFEAIIKLEATNLREIHVDSCRENSDTTLSVIAARHESLECLVIGPDFCKNLTSEAIKAVGFCCHNLRKLCLSGMQCVEADAINALSKYCKNLIDLGFHDCQKVDEAAIATIKSLRYLSVAGTNLRWGRVLLNWYKLPNLIALDVSGTDIKPPAVSEIFSSFSSLKVLCAMQCPVLKNDAAFVSNHHHNGKVLLAVFTNILSGITDVLVDIPNHDGNANAFLYRRSNSKMDDEKFNEILDWLEWILSSSLLRVPNCNQPVVDNFWLIQGVTLLITFLRSAQQEVQERAATKLETFVLTCIDDQRADAIVQNGGIALLLDLAESLTERLQFVAAQAISNLLRNWNVAKAVVEDGGIDVLIDLSSSRNRLITEEATGGLRKLSFFIELQSFITEAGGAKALVDLIFKYFGSYNAFQILLPATEALAALASNCKCTKEIVSGGGVRAFLMIAERCHEIESLQRQAVLALSNLADYDGDCNTNNAVAGQEVGVVEALVRLARSYGVCWIEASRALYDLSLDDKNRERIVAAGGASFMYYDRRYQ